MKIKTVKHIYSIFTIASLLIAGIVTFVIKQNNLPYEFRLDEKEVTGASKIVIVYEDLNNDGISEQIKIAFLKSITNDYINIKSHNGSVLEQINLFSRTNENWFLFDDYNQDSCKEIIAFSQLNDSLFLTIFDFNNYNYILHRQFILPKPDSAFTELTNEWDISVRPIALLDVDNDNVKELLFTVKGGYSIYPRGIYTYDIENKKIINKFESGSPIHKVILEDLNNDGDEEIICSTVGPGNIRKNVTYTDQTSWLFVFNKKLKPIFRPVSYGKEFPESFTIPIKQNNKVLLMFKCKLQLKTGPKGKCFIFSPQGKLLDSLENLSDYYLEPLKVKENKKDILYIGGKNGLVKLSNNFNVMNFNNSFNHKITLISAIPFGKSEEKAILAKYETDIFLFNKNLELLAKYKLRENGAHKVTIKYNGKNKVPQLACIGSENNYLFTITENKLYGYLPLVFIGTGMLSFFVFYISHFGLIFLSTYSKYFGYSLNKSSKGIAIFDYNGKVFYSNKNVKSFLKLNTKLKRRSDYKNIFAEQKEVTSVLEKSMNTREKVSEKIQISSAESQFEGEVTITPFTSFTGFTYAYLMEISDYTEALLTDRGKVWGATLQRIAHEIKTPLSGINLGLNTLSKKLGKKENQYVQDIMLIQNEVDRIKELTKNFLLFSNMEKPNFARIRIDKLLLDSINVFDSYLNSGMEIIIQPSSNIVIGDEHQLKQLFHILIENAIDACEGKGKIEIRCEIQDVKFEYQDTKDKRKNNLVKTVIRDNGKGISNEVLSKIFEPYFTTKKDGTGIGLAIAKKIVEDHKGQIKIESKVGEGTTVSIYLRSA